MKLNPQELEKIASLTLDHYNERAEDFWQGTRDHDVKQNIAALFQWIEGKPPFTILDFGCGPGRDLLDACAMCQTGSPKHQNHRPLHWRQIMAAAQFSLPKQWEDWCSWLLGLWLCISPWALRFDLEPTATRITVITGIFIILAEMMTLSVYRAWEEWINVILGAWLVICPWILGISSSVARVNLIVVGLLVMALAFYEIWEARRQTSSQT